MTQLAVVCVAQVALVALLLVRRRQRDPDIRQLIALVDRLCQRVQAPQTAVLEHREREAPAPTAQYAPPAVEPDDDEGYWEAKERLAEQMMRAEVAARDAEADGG